MRKLDAGGRLLVTRLRYIGDVVLTLPLLRALRDAFPKAELHYLAEAPAIEVLLHHPDVDRLWTQRHGLRDGLRTAMELRAQRFAASIDLFSNPRSAFLVRASGVPVRIGERRRVRRHLYTHARALSPGRSALQQHLDAGALLGASNQVTRAPRIHLSPEERARGRERVDGGRTVQPLVVVHLAATQPEKEWPLELAQAFVKRLVENDHAVLLTTAPQRREPSAAVAQREPRARRLPELPFRELLAVLAAADAVVGVDGGIVHCSVALQRPTLALFGPTDAAVWFPYEAFGPYRVLREPAGCAACAGSGRAHTCMAALPVSEASRHLDALLDPSRPQGPTA
jgi:ADP-heptose:LPS heptosyltransferase